VTPRPLSSDEVALVRRIAGALDPEAAVVLDAQVAEATVVGGRATLLEIGVAPGAPKAALPDGPLAVSATTPDGEVLIWIRRGVLDAIEYAWTSPVPPMGMPSPNTVTVAP
jgi:hypothetical protein